MLEGDRESPADSPTRHGKARVTIGYLNPNRGRRDLCQADAGCRSQPVRWGEGIFAHDAGRLAGSCRIRHRVANF